MKKTVAAKVSPAPVPSKEKVHAAEALTGNGPAVPSAANAPAAEPTAMADVQPSATVTITGCVELDEETFWLKDTAGADVPTSRSWRSGFLKKRSSPIELVDANHTLKLRNYVGQRVAATGMIVNREMRARSLQRVVAPCGKNPKA
jgi:hypothetical protein